MTTPAASARLPAVIAHKAASLQASRVPREPVKRGRVSVSNLTGVAAPPRFVRHPFLRRFLDDFRVRPLAQSLAQEPGMQATALTFTLIGLDAHAIRVEVDSGRGPANFFMVGLPEASVRESRVRVRAALHQVGVHLAEHVITVNLGPADLKKSGGGFDLAIAAATLGALGKVPTEGLAGTALLGELSLTGTLRPVRGVLPALRGALSRGVTRAIVPRDNAREAALVSGVQVGVCDHLSALVKYLKDGTPLDGPGEPPEYSPAFAPAGMDLSDVRGQHGATGARGRGGGGHNLLFMGPPGAGKTMLARSLPTIYASAFAPRGARGNGGPLGRGLLSAERGILAMRPFRAPHHTVSAAGLVGEATRCAPASFASRIAAVLFLDELCEFKGRVLGGAAPASGGRARDDLPERAPARPSRRARSSSRRSTPAPAATQESARVAARALRSASAPTARG